MCRLWVSLCSVTLLGCAAAPPGPLAGASDATLVEEVRTPVSSESDLVCTGATSRSYITGRLCVTRAEHERITEASQEWIRTGGAKGSPYIVPDAADPRTDEPDSE